MQIDETKSEIEERGRWRNMQETIFVFGFANNIRHSISRSGLFGVTNNFEDFSLQIGQVDQIKRKE